MGAMRRPDIDVSDVERMYYEEGMTQQAIADHYGCSLWTIWYRLHPDKWNPNGNNPGIKRPDIDDCDVQYMYEVEGMSQRAIANHYGVCQSTIYWRLHPDKLKENNKIYNQSEKGKATRKKWQQTNKCKVAKKEWWQSEEGKALKRKDNANRRDLGFIALNETFPSSVFHHIDKYHGIYITEELHRSIRHNLKTGKNMDEINKEAFEFLEFEISEGIVKREI